MPLAIVQVSKFFETKTVKGETIPHIMLAVRTRLEKALGPLSADAEAALGSIATLAAEAAAADTPLQTYEFDRKFLFRVLVLGNAQLAQIIKVRLPLARREMMFLAL